MDSLVFDEGGDNAPDCKLIAVLLTLISIFPNGIPVPANVGLLDKWVVESDESSLIRFINPPVLFSELILMFEGDLNAGDSCKIEVGFSLGDEAENGP